MAKGPPEPGRDPQPQRAGPGLWRCAIAALLFLCHVISYADRFNISVAILTMSREYGYSKLVEGHIMASFFYGYIATQVMGGLMASPASTVGPKRCLLAACVTWSGLTLVIPKCADTSLGLLIAARVGLGAAEGLYIPACMALIAAWFPVHERSRITALSHVGQCMGAVIAMACSPIVAHSWQLLFYIFGVAGLVWAVAFALLGADGPASHPFVSQEECDHILGDQRTPEENYGTTEHELPHPPVAYHVIISSMSFWAVAAAHVAYNWSWYIMLSWLPHYLVDVFSVSADRTGSYAIWPYVIASAACLLWARLMDGCLEAELLSLRSARVLSQAMSALGPIAAWVALLALAGHGGVVWASVFVSAAVALQTAGQSGFPANMVDIGGAKHTSRVAAASNTLATVPGIVGNTLVGAILQPGGGGWSLVFVTMICVQLTGLLVFAVFSRAEVQFGRGAGGDRGRVPAKG